MHTYAHQQACLSALMCTLSRQRILPSLCYVCEHHILPGVPAGRSCTAQARISIALNSTAASSLVCAQELHLSGIALSGAGLLSLILGPGQAQGGTASVWAGTHAAGKRAEPPASHAVANMAERPASHAHEDSGLDAAPGHCPWPGRGPAPAATCTHDGGPGSSSAQQQCAAGGARQGLDGLPDAKPCAAYAAVTAAADGRCTGWESQEEASTAVGLVATGMSSLTLAGTSGAAPLQPGSGWVGGSSGSRSSGGCSDGRRGAPSNSGRNGDGSCGPGQEVAAAPGAVVACSTPAAEARAAAAMRAVGSGVDSAHGTGALLDSVFGAAPGLCHLAALTRLELGPMLPPATNVLPPPTMSPLSRAAGAAGDDGIVLEEASAAGGEDVLMVIGPGTIS